MPSLDIQQIPAALKFRPQWLVWRLEGRNGRATKIPYTVDGHHAKSNDPRTWCRFNVAVKALQESNDFDGIGFAFAEGDGLVGIDLDKCISDEGELEAWAAEVIDHFLPTYIEISPSGRGIRIFAIGQPHRCGKGTQEKRIELYDYTSPRYLTVTGRHWDRSGADVLPMQNALDWLHEIFFARLPSAANPVPHDPEGHAMGILPLDDQTLLARALKNPTFATLYRGRWEGYGSQSDADAALCAKLAWWTRGDMAQIDRIFRSSGLMRDKWDKKHAADGRTYGEMTVQFAVSTAREFREDRASTRKGNGNRQDADRPGKGSRGDPAGPTMGDSGGGSNEDDPRPVIRLIAGQLVGILDASEAAVLAQHEGHPFYQRGGQLVRIARLDYCPKSGGTGMGAPMLCGLTSHSLVEIFMRAARYEKFDARLEKWRNTDLPEKFARTYLERSEWNAPVLRSMIEVPLLRKDGSIFADGGYDPVTKCFLQCSVDFRIPGNVTDEDVRWAVELFHDLLDPFSFVQGSDFSAAVALILTSMVRPSLPHAPLFGIRAPVMGSGKTLLGQVVAIVTTGRKIAVINHKPDEKEFDKTLFSTLSKGEPVIFIDNIEKPLSSETLCSISTNETWSDRLLGQSKMVSVPTICTWILTGNNLEIHGDLTRRVVPINLDPECERPYERRFDRDIVAYTMEHRIDLVLAGLTLLKAYADAGRPDQGVTWGSFEAWSDWVRSALLFAGIDDPCIGTRDMESTDRVRMELGQLLTVWHERHKQTPMKAGELIKDAENSLELQEALEAICGDARSHLNPRILGRFLARHAKRIEDGLRLERVGESKRAAMFRVVRVSG